MKSHFKAFSINFPCILFTVLNIILFAKISVGILYYTVLTREFSQKRIQELAASLEAQKTTAPSKYHRCLGHKAFQPPTTKTQKKERKHKKEVYQDLEVNAIQMHPNFENIHVRMNWKALIYFQRQTFLNHLSPVTQQRQSGVIYLQTRHLYTKEVSMHAEETRYKDRQYNCIKLHTIYIYLLSSALGWE